ncbi:MAG: RNA methyltransferase [Lachnospiraceae bacterium]|nr:RNA methyltransferase [Lachnospiraceae bacterium]
MISSTVNPRVKNIVILQKKGKERRRQGVFVIEGRKLFEEVLRDVPEAVDEVYVTESYLSDESRKASLAAVPYEVVSEAVMKVMAETLEPQGILATVRIPEYDKDALFKKEDAVWVALEDIRDPGNLGTILRTAEAAGVTGVILSRDSVDMYNPKVVRSTMGAVFRVPHFYTDDFLTELDRMKQTGAMVYAAHLSGKQYYDEPEYSGRSVILIGNEANGLSEEASEKADCLVKIPMEGRAESLNAAVATSLFVYEAYRKRRNRK